MLDPRPKHTESLLKMRDMREQWEANLYDLYLDDIAFRGLDYEERSRRAKEEAEDVLVSFPTYRP